MFCANCGKELKEDIKFCPVCGVPVNINKAAENNIASEEKNYGTGDYETLRQMLEKAKKVKKVSNVIITILFLVYGYLFMRGLLRMLTSVLENRETITQFAFSVFAVILFTCGLLYVGLEVILPILQGRKAVYAEEYLKCIVVNDKKALMYSLGQMKCSAIKNVYMDERGEVCVAGKRSKHIFEIQNKTPIITSQKSNYKAVLERETIAACLLKFLVPEAPVNAFANEKSNLMLTRMRWLLSIVAITCGVVFIVIAIMRGTGSNYINIVKNGSPEMYSNITYGEAFDDFFNNSEWKYFEAEDGEDVVEFHGTCMYGDDRVQVSMQFVVNEDQETFHVWSATIDGEEQPELVYSLLLLKVFESYTGESQKGYLQLEDDSLLDKKETVADIENEVPDLFAESEITSVIESEESDLFIENSLIVESDLFVENDIVGNNFSETSDNADGGEVEELIDNDVALEDILGLGGRWSDGNIEISIGIYTDSDMYSSYSEVGTCFFGEIMGTLYYLGSDENGFLYLVGELAQGDKFVLQYWGGDTFEIVDASEGLYSAINAILHCEEHYEP